jgi:DNA-binding NarL/FixJ family response regulator
VTPYRVVLADDHSLFRAGVRKLLDEVPGIEVLAEASDGLELLEAMKTVSPDLVILDISMPGMRGVEAAKEIRTRDPRVKVLILTMHRKREYFQHAMSAGAAGYLLKEDADTELFTAIETVRRGGTYLSPILSQDLAKDLVRVSTGQAIESGEALSTRERQVLKLLAEGKSSREIADLLYISVRTVEHHRSNIMGKLNLKNTAEMIRYAIRKGYSEESESV